MALKRSGVMGVESVTSSSVKAEDYALYLQDTWKPVSRLSITAGLPMPKVYVVNDPAPNAFATGRNPENGAVAVNTGLMRMLTRGELAGVIAHELAHIKNRDTLIMTIAATVSATPSRRCGGRGAAAGMPSPVPCRALPSLQAANTPPTG